MLNRIINFINQLFMNENIRAMINTIYIAEGTKKGNLNPYAQVFGYEFEIKDFSNHPFYSSHKWKGGKLSNSMCKNAGLSTGCVSTAAGAGQFLKATWSDVARRAKLTDFSPASQDKAMIQLFKDANAYNDIIKGDLEKALPKLGKIWASLPYNSYQQNPKSHDKIVSIFNQQKKFYV